MRYALFSDIHANWEALETAAKDIADRSINRIAVLGDTIGYGANPNECFEWMIEHADICLLGNHEKAIIDPALRAWFNPMAAEAIVWTEKVIARDWVEKIRGLHYLRLEADFIFAHGSPDNPEEFRYLLSYGDAAGSFRSMDKPVCFVGHTHVPACFCENKKSASYLRPGVIQVDRATRTILNPGSIGQPRDRDPRLSYGIFDDQKWTFEIVRMEYNNQKTAKKIRDAGLPAYLADRLL